MSKTPRTPTIRVELSIRELTAICMALQFALQWISVERDVVKNFLGRIAKRLMAIGIPQDLIDRLTKT